MKKIKLGDVAILKNGVNFSKNERKYNYKCVGVTDFNKKILNNFDEVSEISTDNNLPEEYFLKNNDIILVRSNGNKNLIGRSILVFPENNLATFSGFCIRCRVMKNFADVRYIFYFLQNSLSKGIFALNHQTNINNINQERLKNLEIDLPPLEIQKQIGNFLYSLDEKISLNKKINATLEEMAKTIYLHKFFRKTANGKISNILIENPKSAISVGDAKNSSGDFPFFTSGENILRWNEKIVDGRNIFLNTGGNAGVKFYVGTSAYSTDTWSIYAKNNLSDYFYLLLKIFETELNKKFFQGTGLKHLQKDLLKDFEIYIPTDEELKNFNSAIQPGFDMISKNFRENNLLEKLRDFLLPMLMNGQVGFKEK